MKDTARGTLGIPESQVALSLPVRIDLSQRATYQLEALTVELAGLCKRKVDAPSDSVLALAVVARISELVGMLSVLTDVTCTDMSAEEIDRDLSQWGEPDEFYPTPINEIDARYAKMNGGASRVL